VIECSAHVRKVRFGTPTDCSIKRDVPDHEGDVHKPAIADILIVSASPQSAGPTGPSTNKIALQNGRWQRVATSADIGVGQ